MVSPENRGLEFDSLSGHSEQSKTIVHSERTKTMAEMTQEIELNGTVKTHRTIYSSFAEGITSLKTMAFDTLASSSDLDYSIEQMSDTAFELNIRHEDGTEENYYWRLEK